MDDAAGYLCSLYRRQHTDQILLGDRNDRMTFSQSYLVVRQLLINSIINLVTILTNIHLDALFCTIGLMDMCHVKGLFLKGNIMDKENVLVYTLAIFYVACQYVGDRRQKTYFDDKGRKVHAASFDKIPLRSLTKLYSRCCSDYLTLVMGFQSQFTTKQMQKAIEEVTTKTDWRFNLATSNKFLNVWIHWQHFNDHNFQQLWSLQKFWPAEFDFDITQNAYLLCAQATKNNISFYYKASTIAQASILASRFLKDLRPYLPTFASYYGETEPDLIMCVKDVLLTWNPEKANNWSRVFSETFHAGEFSFPTWKMETTGCLPLLSRDILNEYFEKLDVAVLSDSAAGLQEPKALQEPEPAILPNHWESLSPHSLFSTCDDSPTSLLFKCDESPPRQECQAAWQASSSMFQVRRSKKRGAKQVGSPHPLFAGPLLTFQETPTTDENRQESSRSLLDLTCTEKMTPNWDLQSSQICETIQ